jgi:hypothetical protein
MLTAYEQATVATVLNYLTRSDAPWRTALQVAVAAGGFLCVALGLRFPAVLSIVPTAVVFWYVLTICVAMGHFGLDATAADAQNADGTAQLLSSGAQVGIFVGAVVCALLNAATLLGRAMYFRRRILQMSATEVAQSDEAELAVRRYARQQQQAEGAAVLAAYGSVSSTLPPPAAARSSQCMGVQAPDTPLTEATALISVTPATVEPEMSARVHRDWRLRVALRRFGVLFPSTNFGPVFGAAVGLACFGVYITCNAYHDRLSMEAALQKYAHHGLLSSVIGGGMFVGAIMEQLLPLTMVACGATTLGPAMAVAATVALNHHGLCRSVWAYVLPLLSHITQTHRVPDATYFGSGSGSVSFNSGSGVPAFLPPNSSGGGSAASSAASSGDDACVLDRGSETAASVLALSGLFLSLLSLVLSLCYRCGYVRRARRAEVLRLTDVDGTSFNPRAPVVSAVVYQAVPVDEYAQLLGAGTRSHREQEVGTTVPEWQQVKI